MRIMNNTSAINAHRLYTFNNSKLSKSLEKLSSGYAINRAGDNAAGLAVSEKMRAQIAGLEQASKNAQDGISMVQTYEGALTETDSILQRMRSLAVQSANGTYDNSVDRVAIEQEFKQLNDELNQIADTDFNGVVVLNGGEMADGLKAVDGVFDYNNKASQVAAENAEALAKAQEDAQAKIDAAQKTFDNAKAAYDAVENRDLCLAGENGKWNTIDDNAYTQGIANKLFNTAENADGDTLFDADVDSFNVQFEFNGTSWAIKTDTTVDGESIDTGAWYVDGDGEIQEVDLTNTQLLDSNIATTTNGGFSIYGGALGNSVFATKEAKEGDVITLTYTNSASSSYAPTNIGMDEESLRDGVGLGGVPTIKLSDAAKNNAAMDEEMMAALEKLDNAEVSFQYSKSGIEATISDDSLIITEGAKSNEFNISFKNAQGKEIQLATVTTTKAHAASAAKAGTTSTGAAKATTVTSANNGTGNSVTVAANEVTLTYDANDNKWKTTDGTVFDFNTNSSLLGFQLGKADTDFVDGTAAHGDKLTLSVAQATVANGAGATVNVAYERANGTTVLGANATETTTTTLTYVDGVGWTEDGKNEWDDTADTIGGQTGFDPTTMVSGTALDGDKMVISATSGKKSVEVSYKASDATVGVVKFGIALDEGKYDPASAKQTIDTAISPNGTDSTAVDSAYEKAKAALNEAKAAYPKTVDDLGEEYGVSKSNALEQATAKLTYNEGMSLQVGARTKDLVDFTFTYDAEAIGDLEADLNCTAKGLGTAGLSLATQESANDAIDKIDHAINKVSMVRGTFGAIQNRLEHKINNLDVNNENLTAAESRIRDTDMAAEMMEFTKNQILSQASQSMLAQANQLPQGVLSLLQ